MRRKFIVGSVLGVAGRFPAFLSDLCRLQRYFCVTRLHICVFTSLAVGTQHGSWVRLGGIQVSGGMRPELFGLLSSVFGVMQLFFALSL